MNQWEREELQLERELEKGLITQQEYNRAVRELHRDYRECARDSAERAYHDEMDRW